MRGDEECYQLFLQGDTASFDQLMLRYGDNLTFYLYGYLHDWQDAEDMMIDAFARIMVKKPVIRTGGFKTYLYKTARNLAARFHTRGVRVKVFGFDDLGEETADQILLEEGILDKERRRILYLCLERIDPLLREALWLVYIEELSYAQAASVMKVNVKRIDHLLQRGKEHMRRELAKEGVTHAYN